MTKFKRLRQIAIVVCATLLISCLSVFGFSTLAGNQDNTVIAIASSSVAYDGVPVTPIKINGENYRSFGLSDEDWSQFDGFYAIRNAKELYGYAALNAKTDTAPYSAVLLDNIVVNETVSANGAKYTWIPMKSKARGDYYKNFFNGTFDGNGYFISGLILLLTSLIIPYKIYYVVFSSILFLLSLICRLRPKNKINKSIFD